MKSYFLLIFLCFFILQKNQAQNECIDSISFNRYVSPYFGFPNATSVTLRDAVGNIYINGFGSLPGEINYNIAKFNIENKLVWFKTFKQIPGNQVSLTGLKELDGKTNLVFAIGAGNATNTTVVKLDSSATFLWGRKFERIDFPLVQGTISGIVTDNTENTYLSGFFVDDIEKSNIVKIDGTGTINWSKKYGNINLSKFHVLQRQLVSQNPGTLVLFTHFYYDADLPTESNAKHGLAMVKISKANGSIISQKVMMYYNNNIGTNQNLFTLKKVNYSTATRTFLIDSWGQVIPPFSRSHILTLMDDDLNPIKTVLYNSYFINPVENLMVNDKNEMVFTINRPIYNGNPENSLAYITVADNLEIIRQKK